MPNGKGGSNRGFAAMDPEKQREISRKGGLSVAPKDRSFSRDRSLASNAGRKGAISRNAERRSQSSMPANSNAGAIQTGQVKGGERNDQRDIDTEDIGTEETTEREVVGQGRAASGEGEPGGGMSAGESDADVEERRSPSSDDDDGMR